MRSAIILAAIIIGMSLEHLSGRVFDVGKPVETFIGIYFSICIALDIIEFFWKL